MARKRNSVSATRKTEAATDQAADAAVSALGFAMHGTFNGDPLEAADKMNGLAGLCDRAADHMALAHNLIAAHVDHTDTAIDHLDAALGCLKQIVVESEPASGAKPAKGARAGRSAKTA